MNLKYALFMMPWVAAWSVGVTGDAAWSQSLWTHREATKSHFFIDQQARHVGDILTVIVREMTDVQNKDQKALGRRASHGGGLSISGLISGMAGEAEGESELDLSLTDRGSFDGSAETKIAREFVDRITVTVVDVYPNGNLRICGHRDQIVNGETRKLEIRGIVRPQDVRADNSVESRYIADFCMGYNSSGEDTDYTKRGWLGRWWQKFRP